MRTMKAAVFEGINQIAIKEIPMPVPREGWALIKVRAAGLCITDVHVLQGLLKHSQPPCILGHEVAGEIVSFGRAEWPIHLKEGDRVVIETMVACGACAQCLGGFKNLCENGQDIGENQYQGGYSEYICVPTGCLYKIPEGMSFEEAAIFESFVCPVGGLNRLGVEMSDVVLIQGLGPAGLAFVQAAKVMGAKTVIVCDTKKERLDLARRYGADVLINPLEESPEAVVRKETKGIGADISIEASGAEAAIVNALNLCRKNGKVIFYGIPKEGHKTHFDVTQIIVKQLNLFGTSGAPWAWQRTLDLYGQGRFCIKDMITHEFALEQIEEAIKVLSAPDSKAIKIVLKP